MVDWSYWFPDVLPHVRGCPSDIAVHELKRTAQEFFRRTRAWQKEEPLVPVAAGQKTVLIAPSDFTLDLVRVESIYFDKDHLTPTTPETLDGMYGDKWEANSASKPDSFYQLTAGEIRLYPIPLADATEGLKVRVSVTPGESAEGIPDDMAIKFRDPIYLGARARLMIYKDSPWYDPSMAAVYGAAFSAAVDKYTLDKARSFTNARIKSRPKWC